MNIKVIKNDFNLVFDEIKKNTPIIIFKKLVKTNECKKLVSICHNEFSYKLQRKTTPNKYFNFFSVDVLPSNVKSNRIFRTFELSNFFIDQFNFIKKIQNLQNKITKLKKNKKIYRKVQVIQYPCGGGFFDEHKHSRYPTNYGLILTLTEKNKDFKKGVTNFKINKKKIDIENFGVSIGDLILFRYDLPHSVSQCDPDNDLKFDKKGRWTLVFPVYHQKF